MTRLSKHTANTPMKRAHPIAFPNGQELAAHAIRAMTALRDDNIVTYMNLVDDYPDIASLDIGESDMTLLDAVTRAALRQDCVNNFTYAAIKTIRASRNKEVVTRAMARLIYSYSDPGLLTSRVDMLTTEFLAAGADPNALVVNSDGLIMRESVLERAVSIGDTNLVEKLVEARADVTCTCEADARRLLIDHVPINSFYILRHLLEAGATTSSGTVLTTSILCSAVIQGFDKVVRLLVEHKANVNVIAGDDAVQSDDIVELLRGRRTVPLLGLSCDDNMVKLLLSLRADPDLATDDGFTALDVCELSSVTTTLIQHGAHAGKGGALTAMDTAFRTSDHCVLDMLLSAGARFDYDCHTPSSSAVVMALLAHGVELWRSVYAQQIVLRLHDAQHITTIQQNHVTTFINHGVMPVDPTGVYRYDVRRDKRVSCFHQYRYRVAHVLDTAPNLVDTVSIDCRNIILDYICPWKPGSQRDQVEAIRERLSTV